MERLTNDTAFIELNTDIRAVKKKKPLNRNGCLIYRLDRLFDVDLPDGYEAYFAPYKVKLFSLESLKQIISIAESKLRLNIRRDLIFYTDSVIVMSDNLTVSMTEYAVAYYLEVYGIHIYISYGHVSGKELIIGLEDDERQIHNGFDTGEATSCFLADSFLPGWGVNGAELTDESFFCRHEGSRRLKIHVGTGPWDASEAISRCTEFLEKADISGEAIASVCDVIGELAPNAVEHGGASCIADVAYNRYTDLEGHERTTISIVVYNFSDKLLWTDLYSKVFEDYGSITHKRDRVDHVREAWGNHSRQFDARYAKRDFYNLMAFQSISGRKGDRSDGGLGIRMLVQNVQEHCDNDYCYVLSGSNALMMFRDITVPDNENYVAFNEAGQYVERIPDEKAVAHTGFFMPGVAYNLTFNF